MWKSFDFGKNFLEKFLFCEKLRFFQVALFAELFSDMICRDSAFRILKSILAIPEPAKPVAESAEAESMDTAEFQVKDEVKVGFFKFWRIFKNVSNVQALKSTQKVK